MRGFFKTFFAALLALVIFTIIGVLILIGIVAGATSPEKPFVGSRAVLVLDLSDHFKERSVDDRLGRLFSGDDDAPSLHEVIRLLDHARADSAVKGVYILCGGNNNGFAASEELRKSLTAFRGSRKFVVAYGETISQKGYYVGNVADRIYCHPQGGVEWQGFSSELLFLKGTLDKLEIKPQIFYAGKFKSATEPLRETKMTDANRLQTSVWLGDLYNHFLFTASQSRNIDSAKLRSLAVSGTIQTAADALNNNLVDGLKYDDEVKAEILALLRQNPKEKINFVPIAEYAKAVDLKQDYSAKKIAIVYADGDINGGSSDNGQVGSDAYKNIIRKLRLDDDVKAIVFRVNSPGGSALASDVIWREITLARKSKPVVVSMGDVAASGGYYISCNADSVFADANTITGSIGVFSIIPDMESFFRNKLGVTFDGVKTAPYADLGNPGRPLNETEKRFMQSSVDTIYNTFKTRVSEGRKKSIAYIDSIAQGRVWTGARSIGIGLTDRIGTMQDALACAARMAGIQDYRLKEYPEKKTLLEQLMNNYKRSVSAGIMKEEIGADQVKLLQQMKQVREMFGVPQMRLPFTAAIR